MGGKLSSSSGGHVEIGDSLKIEWGVCSHQGLRDSQEDNYAIDPRLGAGKTMAAFSVFDGHYGPKAAKLASKVLHPYVKASLAKNHPESKLDSLDSGKAVFQDAFAKTDQEILSHGFDDGCAVLFSLITEAGIWFANAGDCRALVCRADGKFEQVTVDHNCNNRTEHARITGEGGNITFGRIDGKLNVARGFGDRPFKNPKPYVTHIPDVHFVPLKDQPADVEPVEFVVIASDGVWGWVNNEQASKLVRRKLRNHEEEPEDNEDDMKHLRPKNLVERVCCDLVKLASQSNSSDNITTDRPTEGASGLGEKSRAAASAVRSASHLSPYWSAAMAQQPTRQAHLFQIPGLDPGISATVPLAHRREATQLFHFPINYWDEPEEPETRETLIERAMARTSITAQFSEGFLLGFLFSFVQARIKSFYQHVRVYGWNPDRLTLLHLDRTARVTVLPGFWKAHNFGLAFGVFSGLLGFFEPLTARWYGSPSAISVGIAGGLTSGLLALAPALKEVKEAWFMYRILRQARKRAYPAFFLGLSNLAQHFAQSFAFGFALMGGVEMIGGGQAGQLPPEDDLQGYPPLSISPEAVKAMGGAR